MTSEERIALLCGIAATLAPTLQKETQLFTITDEDGCVLDKRSAKDLAQSAAVLLDAVIDLVEPEDE